MNSLSNPSAIGLFSSVFTPRSLSGLVLWANSTLSVTGLADGASVGNITDLSGSGNNLVQATGALQPTFKTNQINGKPAFRHDVSGTQFVQSVFALNAPQTMFLVYKQNSFQGAGGRDIVWDGGILFSSLLLASNTVNQKWNLNAALAYNTQVADGVYAYVTAVYDVAGLGRVNGVQVEAGNISSNAGGVTIGGSAAGTRGAQIDWTETIWYNRHLSAAEIIRIEDYLKNAYAL